MNKIGVADYGMGVWEGGAFSTERRLATVKECGYKGIEVLRGRSVEDMVNKAAVFRKMGMDFISCNVADDHENTFRCAAALGCEYVWLNCGRSTRDVSYETYIRRAKEYVKCAADWGMKCALHNHLGTVIESEEELHRFMNDVPEALLLFDVGHLAAMEGDVTGVITRYIDRLAAVHIKDVLIKNAEIPMGADNWWDRLEFREFGAGDIGLDIPGVVKHLKKSGFDKWLLVEQDTHKREPALDLRHNLKVIEEALS